MSVPGREAEAEATRQRVEAARAEQRQRRLERDAMTASHRRRMVEGRPEGSRQHRRRRQPQNEEPQFEEPHYEPIQYDLPQYEPPRYEEPPQYEEAHYEAPPYEESQYEGHDEDEGDEDERSAEMSIDDDPQAEGGPGPFPGGPYVTSLLPSFRDHIAYRLWHGEVIIVYCFKII